MTCSRTLGIRGPRVLGGLRALYKQGNVLVEAGLSVQAVTAPSIANSPPVT
jgi:hypothetical protein